MENLILSTAPAHRKLTVVMFTNTITILGCLESVEEAIEEVVLKVWGVLLFQFPVNTVWQLRNTPSLIPGSLTVASPDMQLLHNFTLH